MPKKPALHYLELGRRLREQLLRGPSTAHAIRAFLGISQTAFLHLVSLEQKNLLVLGKARNTEYAWRRKIPQVEDEVKIYSIDQKGRSRHFADLYAIHPRGFYFKAASGLSRLFKDLPYFLYDLEPRGFLGRIVPNLYPHEDFPKDIRLWNVEHSMRYLTKYGWNLVGNLIVGEAAFQLYLSARAQGPHCISPKDRGKLYPKLAEQIMSVGDPGSSAGGEQPKFLAIKAPQEIPVLVKFSAPKDNRIAERRADLLVCEHFAHEVLTAYKFASARSELISAQRQIFLEIERFDRVKSGRLGLISLLALDLEFAGEGRTWTAAAKTLTDQGRITIEMYEKIQWLEIFGQLIGNTDMHLANISFYFEDLMVTGLAPTYDMLPMLYAPQNEQIQDRVFHPAPPHPQQAKLWRTAWPAAIDFWQRTANSSEVSTNFRKIAKENLEKIKALKKIVALLPEGS